MIPVNRYSAVTRGYLRRVLIAVLAAAAMLIVSTSATHAAGSLTAILRALQNGNVYMSQGVIRAGHASSGDAARLQVQASDGASHGIQEKFAVLNSAPGTPAQAAHTLRGYLNFSGLLVLVDPNGIGLSSGGVISASDEQSIAQAVAADCLTKGFGICALEAGQRAVTVHASNAATSSHNAAVFWLIVLAIFAIIVFGLVFAATRRRRTTAANLNELRSAVSNTLSLADTAVEQIEQAIAGVAPSQQVRASYDRALALRDQARQEMDRGGTQAELTQANQDAAQAVLALQGVMRELGMQEPLANPLDAPGRRCFYCGRDDRPPYTQQTISDGKGNSMEIWVCGVDQERLAQGRTPQVATVGYNGMQMPWWAVPNNPWYYSYGGPTWQYWLPFIIGMDVGGWFGGGWGNPGLYGGVGDWDDGGQALNAGDQGMAATPSDSGGVDFGGWGDGGSSGDSGGWDSGGWDSSGGGWDSGGGGDFGGDSGGGGWS